MAFKKFSVYWTASAQNDLIEIIDYISDDNSDSAEKIFENIKDHSIKLSGFLERGRIVPELKFHNIDTYREIIISPWRLIYRIEEKKVYILALIDGRRNFEDILLQRIMRE